MPWVVRMSINVWYAKGPIVSFLHLTNRLRSRLTLQKWFDLGEFGRVIELPEVFGLLCDLFPLNQRILLVVHDFRRRTVELRNELGEIDACAPVLVHGPVSLYEAPYHAMLRSLAGTCSPVLIWVRGCWKSVALRPHADSLLLRREHPCRKVW